MMRDLEYGRLEPGAHTGDDHGPPSCTRIRPGFGKVRYGSWCDTLSVEASTATRYRVEAVVAGQEQGAEAGRPQLRGLKTGWKPSFSLAFACDATRPEGGAIPSSW
jgi:hypothetical protein